MMMHGRNNCKKLMTVRIVKYAFEIIHLLTGENPLDLWEGSTRIGRAGTVRQQVVDVSPLHHVNQAIWLLCNGAHEAPFRNIKTILSAWQISSSMPPRAPPTPMPSRRRRSCSGEGGEEEGGEGEGGEGGEGEEGEEEEKEEEQEGEGEGGEGEGTNFIEFKRFLKIQ
ncbi:hypothetical protein H8959_000247, partial [Pygathrix nigripes]